MKIYHAMHGHEPVRFMHINPNGTLKWQYNTGASIESSPALGPDGTVYVGSQNHNLYALDPATGLVKSGWPYSTGWEVDGSPAISADGTIYFGSMDGKIYALNPDRTPSKSTLWPYYAGGQVFSSPVIGANNMLYVGSGSGRLYAFWNDVGPGSTAWPMFRCGSKRTGNAANTW